MKKKLAFTIAEIILTLALIVSAIAFMVPALKSKTPNSDKLKIRQTYSQILQITQLLLDNISIYPDTSGFKNETPYTDKEDGLEYKGGTKFPDLFKSKLNVLKDYVEISGSNVPICCSRITTDTDRNDDCLIDGSGSQTTCFTTNNNVTYCLPKNTSHEKCFGGADDDKYNETNFAVVKVFYDDNLTDKNGFYFAISAKGKVVLLPPEIAFNDADCGKDEYYKTHNQCKLNDILRLTRTTD